MYRIMSIMLLLIALGAAVGLIVSLGLPDWGEYLLAMLLFLFSAAAASTAADKEEEDDL